jgi:putative transposase
MPQTIAKTPTTESTAIIQKSIACTPSNPWLAIRCNEFVTHGGHHHNRVVVVDTQGLVLKARLHSAEIQDGDGIKLLLEIATWDRLPQRLSHLWMDAGYTGEDKGADWVHRVLGGTAEIVPHPPKMAPEEVMMTWVREWAKEGIAIEREKLLSAKGPRAFLPKRWVVEHPFSWLGQNRRLSKDYGRLPESSEAFIYVAMSRLMVRRLARS